MKRIRTIGLFFAATLLAGCGGGGTSTPKAKAAAVLPNKASASVRFLWPARAGSSATRNARYISPSTDHITITNTYYGTYYLAPSDLAVRVPFGTPTASLPTYVGYNTWSFVEYSSADDSGKPIATATAGAYVDTASSPTIDVALNLNLSNMGASIASDPGVLVSMNDLVQLPPTHGAVSLYGGTAGTFVLYFAPLDGLNNAVSGPGTPGLVLQSTSANLTVARTKNLNTTGPNVGKIAYTVSFSGITYFTSMPLQLFGFDASGQTFIGTIDVTVLNAG